MHLQSTNRGCIPTKANLHHKDKEAKILKQKSKSSKHPNDKI